MTEPDFHFFKGLEKISIFCFIFGLDVLTRKYFKTKNKELHNFILGFLGKIGLRYETNGY